MLSIPTRFFLSSGIGVHREPSPAFELALRVADIEQHAVPNSSSLGSQ